MYCRDLILCLSHHCRAAAPKLSALSAMQAHSALLQGGTPLASLVLFSSVATLVGAAGQASYVTANSGMDAWACQSAAAGEGALPSVSMYPPECHVQQYYHSSAGGRLGIFLPSVMCAGPVYASCSPAMPPPPPPTPAGLPCTSVQWGAWSSAGMASESVKARLQRIGQGVLSPEVST